MRPINCPPYDKLYATDPVEPHSDQFQGLLDRLVSDEIVPPIVVIAEPALGDGRYLILDGNHRAAASAVLKISVPAVELNHDKDSDGLLQLEEEGTLDRFPHREFLAREISISELRRRALFEAGRNVGLRSVEEVADDFHESELARREHERALQVAEENAYRFEMLRPTPEHEPVRRKSGQPEHVVSSQFERSNYSVNSVVTPRISRFQIATHDEELVSELLRRFRENHRDLSVGEEFPCTYGDLARICGECNNRGQTVANALIRLGVIERVGVRQVETGDVYPSGRPMTQRKTFWRLLKDE